MSAYAFDPKKWGVSLKQTVSKVLPIIVLDTLNKSMDPAKELKQYNIHTPMEIYMISRDDDTWYLQHGETRTIIPADCVRDVALWLKQELENKESESIPLPGTKVYRPVLCLLGELLDEHLPMFREGRSGKTFIVTDAEGPSIKYKFVALRQFYRNVEDDTYGPYFDKIIFTQDGDVFIENADANYTAEIGLAVAACLSTNTCTVSNAPFEQL